jgi:CSLREA domain-containing protein
MFIFKSTPRVSAVLINLTMGLILLIGSASFPTNARAASTITVATNADELNSNGLCSLREAITNANDDAQTYMDCVFGSGNDTIQFNEILLGTTTITLGSSLPNITDADGLTINGGGNVTVSGNDLYRILIIDGSVPLTLNQLTLTNANSGALGNGGAIYNAGVLTVTNSIFTNNDGGLGGAIASAETTGTLSVTNSVFSGNTAAQDGGAIFSDVSTTIKNSTFSNNTAAVGASGGGIYVTGGTLTVANSTFFGNSANQYGGGVASQGIVTMANSTFSANSAAVAGGAISNNGTLHLQNTILANSVAGGDCFNASGDAIATNTNNLIETNAASGHRCGTPMLTSDPNLVALTGSPAYFPLNGGSNAIDAGNDSICAAAPVNNASQNGATRPVGTHCDIGSFEFMQTFTDVPTSHQYWEDIEIIYANGLTAGCSFTPLNFCPDQIMDRAQSAVFNLRGNFGVSYTPPAAPWDRFADDWSAGAWAERWAEGMYNAGLTAGCATSPLRYCPWDQTPKVQAAVFGLRLKYGNSYVPPVASGTVFADMTNTAYFGTKWAEQAYANGLLPNCGIGSGGKPKFCPDDLVSRGLAAYMIVRAKNLSMP